MEEWHVLRTALIWILLSNSMALVALSALLFASSSHKKRLKNIEIMLRTLCDEKTQDKEGMRR